MNAYYVREIRTFDSDRETRTIFEFDFTNDSYSCISIGDTIHTHKGESSIKSVLPNHLSYIKNSVKNGKFSVSYDVLTEDQVEEELFEYGL